MSSTTFSPSTKLNKVGASYRGFTLNRSLEIGELQASLRTLTHTKTGAEVLHIACDDPENVFCLSLPTYPYDHTGVAHILEHTVLCGSKKFPVKDPFFAMIRRSLNTFMNAFTASDATMYPGASQVPEDFYNLLEVYLDAVFHPNLRELSFQQEGHRFQFAEADDSSTPLEYHGIVYNEMKGAMQVPMSRLWEAVNHALFPDITYGYNSGGDPKHIPELTYEQLRNFHRTYYAPSRCLFYFYGNLPLEGHLDFLLKNCLERAERSSPLPPIPKQQRFTNPKQVTASFPFAEDQDATRQAMVAVAWLCCPILEQEEVLALNVLQIILMSSDAAPLKHALLKSNLCQQASSHLEDDISEVSFLLHCKGCRKEDQKELSSLIFNTLEKIAQEGIPEDLIDSALHLLELSRSEIGSDGYPFGLQLFFRSALLLQHGTPPENGLMIHELFKKLRKRREENPKLFSELIERYLLTNNHRVEVTLLPDSNLIKEEEKEERARLDAIQERLNTKEKKAIIEESRKLEAFQEEQEQADLDCLPKISLSAVPKETRTFPLTQKPLTSLTRYTHPAFTNEVAYFDLYFPLQELSKEELPFLTLLTNLASQVGCGRRSWVENLEWVQRYTGGVSLGASLNMQAESCGAYQPQLVLRGKALYHNVEKLAQLTQEMLSSLDFSDLTRLRDLIEKQYTSLSLSLPSQAVKYALSLSASALGGAFAFTESTGGLHYYHFLQELVQNFDTKGKAFQEKLIELQKRLLCYQNADLVIGGDQILIEKLEQNSHYGLDTLPSTDERSWHSPCMETGVTSHGRSLSSPVAFTGMTLKTVPYLNPQSAFLGLAAYIANNRTLHPRIREQGGAYGGGASCNALGGTFSFYSYRDPNIASTRAAFQESVERITEGDFTESDLEEAKREKIQGLDNPIAPGSRADLEYGWLQAGLSPERRQQTRDRILNATQEEVQKAVTELILPNMDRGALVTFAARELIEKEASDLEIKTI